MASRMVLDGKSFMVPDTVRLAVEMSRSEGLFITARYAHSDGTVEEITDRCESCGRFSTAPVIAHNVERAVELGWLIPDGD